MQIAFAILAILVLGAIVGTTLNFAGLFLGIPIVLIFVGVLVGKETIDRQRRIMQMKRFRQDAQARRVEQTPEHFVFALKASRYLTHIKRLTDMQQGVERYYDSIAPLVGSPKLGPIVWQLPDNFKRDDERLCNLLENLRPGRHCVEFRNEGWFRDEVYALLREYGVALAIRGHPKLPHVAHELTADWTLIRFHYGRRGRRGNYSETELEEWAQRIEEWRQRAEVYLYFNNDWEGFAIRNGLWMRARLGA